ncbi:MAG: hypothetical protein WC516_06650 [Patescibacteria group bacterium]|jgi:hypothetical protein
MRLRDFETGTKVWVYKNWKYQDFFSPPERKYIGHIIFNFIRDNRRLGCSHNHRIMKGIVIDGKDVFDDPNYDKISQSMISRDKIIRLNSLKLVKFGCDYED